MNGLPYIETAENKFYTTNSPVYFAQRIGSAPAPTINISGSASPSESQRLGFNRNYFTLTNGILRVVLIVFLGAGIISAAAIVRSITGSPNPDFNSTRTAYLVFVVAAFIVSLFIFVLNAFNVTNLRRLDRIPWTLIFVILDGAFFLAILAVSIACAARESQLVYYDPNGVFYNKGAFGAAAAFGLFSSVLLLVLVIFWLIDYLRERRFRNTRSTESNKTSQPHTVNTIDKQISEVI